MRISVGTRPLSLIIPLSLALSACVSDAPNHLPPAITSADVIPIDAQTEKDDRLEKWVHPVRISLVGNVAERDRDHSENRARWLQGITGHRIAIQNSPTGNLILIFEDGDPDTMLTRHGSVWAPLYTNEAALKADLRDDGEQELCIAKRAVSRSDPYEIVYAVGVIPGHLESHELKPCIERLLISAMSTSISKGRPLVEPASSTDTPTDEKIGKGIKVFAQVILLRVSYDQRVKPGMTTTEVQPITLEVSQKLLKTLK